MDTSGSVDAATFFGLHPGDGPGRWQLPVERAICSGVGTLFGGSALGAAADAVERTTGRTVLWASAQFLSFAWPGTTVDLEVTTLAEGRRFTQTRVVGTGPDGDVFHVAATAGRGSRDLHGAWASRPTVLPPEDCPTSSLPDRVRGTVISRMELRRAVAADAPGNEPGVLGPGRGAFWVRIPGLATSAGALGLVGDLVPAAISLAVGQRVIVQSLDNTLRVLRTDPTDWYLVDLRLHGVSHGVGHATGHLWAEDGTLLASASQTGLLRPPPDDGDVVAAGGGGAPR